MKKEYNLSISKFRLVSVFSLVSMSWIGISEVVVERCLAKHTSESAKNKKI